MAGLEQRKEERRDARRLHWLTDFLADMRYAIRSLRRTPALAPGGVRRSIDDDFPMPTQQDLELLKRLAESGALKPVIDRRYRLEDIVEAHRYVELGHKTGSVILTMRGRRR
jgi:NADPH:quinone reductase-like Zn-dependent oxidoreductase